MKGERRYFASSAPYYTSSTCCLNPKRRKTSQTIAAQGATRLSHTHYFPHVHFVPRAVLAESALIADTPAVEEGDALFDVSMLERDASRDAKYLFQQSTNDKWSPGLSVFHLGNDAFLGCSSAGLCISLRALALGVCWRREGDICGCFFVFFKYCLIWGRRYQCSRVVTGLHAHFLGIRLRRHISKKKIHALQVKIRSFFFNGPAFMTKHAHGHTRTDD